MKKVLFTTAALIATSTVAVAGDVNFSGFGRFGLVYSDPNGGANSGKVAMHSRLQFDIEASTTSDQGIKFGAKFRTRPTVNSNFFRNGVLVTRAANTTATGAGWNAPQFYVSANGLTVRVGNVLGAFDSMPNLYHGSIGLTGMSFANVPTLGGVLTHDNLSYSSGGGGLAQGKEVEYSNGMYGVMLTHGYVGTTSKTQITGNVEFNGWTFAAGYQDNAVGPETEWLATLGGNIGPASVAAKVADNGTDGMFYVLSGSFSVNTATSVQAYVSIDENNTNTSVAGNQTNFGLGFIHNLGGGASVRGGVERAYGGTKADLGVRFNF
ncbi:hypothetical protein ATO6_04590 [Oceanicola sp. 22II-s10i]|uniref:porin n=1 Tax=Oceanicola sp. 22II-s10i TaxID=1317116 RepID=UPI000B520754|nr:porin [Oceanicola sp. 22II-s10i]OWU86139.1 hypothetical protein ATO6_04590 [Oceanicola sp. 22II-s10i]